MNQPIKPPPSAPIAAYVMIQARKIQSTLDPTLIASLVKRHSSEASDEFVANHPSSVLGIEGLPKNLRANPSEQKPKDQKPKDQKPKKERIERPNLLQLRAEGAELSFLPKVAKVQKVQTITHPNEPQASEASEVSLDRSLDRHDRSLLDRNPHLATLHTVGTRIKLIGDQEGIRSMPASLEHRQVLSETAYGAMNANSQLSILFEGIRVRPAETRVEEPKPEQITPLWYLFSGPEGADQEINCPESFKILPDNYNRSGIGLQRYQEALVGRMLRNGTIDRALCVFPITKPGRASKQREFVLQNQIVAHVGKDHLKILPQEVVEGAHQFCESKDDGVVGRVEIHSQPYMRGAEYLAPVWSVEARSLGEARSSAINALANGALLARIHLSKRPSEKDFPTNLNGQSLWVLTSEGNGWVVTLTRSGMARLIPSVKMPEKRNLPNVWQKRYPKDNRIWQKNHATDRAIFSRG